MPITIRFDEAKRRGADREPLLVRLRNWLIGPPPGTIPPPEAESPETARARRELEDLHPEGLAKAISEVMWAQRGSLRIVATVTDCRTRGAHSSEERSFRVTMPEGIVLDFDEKLEFVTVTAPDGESQRFTEEHRDIMIVWKAIQGMSMCNAMGVEVPSEKGGIRPRAVIQALDAAICSIVERSDPQRSKETFEHRNYSSDLDQPDWIPLQSAWKDIGFGVFLDDSKTTESYYGNGPKPTWYRIMTPEMGVLRLPRDALANALERRKRTSFANALGLARVLPAHLPMPSGNAQAARVLRLCREAVAREPELVDAKGTPIAPLVEQHLPRLMQKHAEAARIAETSELAAIDAELMQGIERVRLAVEEALVVSRVDKREALRTELAFLEYRHPNPSILSLDAPKDAA